MIKKIAMISEHRKAAKKRVLVGIGDDAAVIDGNPGKKILATVDSQVEGVHFDLSQTSWENVGRRVGAVNLSDIAAMGGVPDWALVSIGVPPKAKDENIQSLYQGLTQILSDADVSIVGGNTARTAEQLFVDLFLIGYGDAKGVLLRSAAKVGDLLCVTGALGKSWAGYNLLNVEQLKIDRSVIDLTLQRNAVEAHLTPTPQLKCGTILGKSLGVHACIDVSDGLLQDAAHIANSSNVNIVIDAKQIPVSPLAAAVGEQLDEDSFGQAISFGEDFELLFTVSKDSAQSIICAVESQTGVKVSIIGVVEDLEPALKPTVTLKRDGKIIDIKQKGFDHFLKR